MLFWALHASLTQYFDWIFRSSTRPPEATSLSLSLSLAPSFTLAGGNLVSPRLHPRKRRRTMTGQRRVVPDDTLRVPINYETNKKKKKKNSYFPEAKNASVRAISPTDFGKISYTNEPISSILLFLHQRGDKSENLERWKITRSIKFIDRYVG